MKLRWSGLFAVAIIAMLAVASCADTNNDDDVAEIDTPQSETTDEAADADQENEPVETTEPESTDDTAAEPVETAEDAAEEATPEGDADEGSQDDAIAESETDASAGDGVQTFVVSDAGEVDLERDGDVLTLVEVRANDGWDHRIDEDDDDNEIEVDFRQDGREVDFDAEIESSRLKIEIDDKHRDAEDGVYVVGEAGEVEFERDGDQLTLIEARPADGWEHTVDDRDSNEIEVDFRRESDEVDFEAEIDDGRLEVEIETKEYVDEAQG